MSALREDSQPEGYAAFARCWADAGASIAGGCCGIGPEQGLSAISWGRHIMGCKSHGYADEEEKANRSASGSGPRAAA
ncbi:homocysteine S-methyltransferase family protein [Burkholderia multivorans]|uniref:homocysteine S-methyltransferase family protein n=1 Tax=Burkholderia multivorans TaxID=87883 RepID=UPI0012D9B26A